MKIEKEYVLSDSGINCYGFRLLTSGYQLSEFQRNPIGFYMHQREGGVVVRWEDLTIKGDSIVGKPNINLDNERGQRTYDEVTQGFLNAASVGNIYVLAYSEDPKDMLPGQTGITVTKWYNQECSLVDMPGNPNAMALYNSKGSLMNLSSINTKHLNIYLQAELGELLKLSGEQLWHEGKFERLKELSYSDFQFKFKQQFGVFYKEEKTPRLSNQLANTLMENIYKNEIDELIKLDGKELHLTGKLERLKQLSMTAFKSKFKECFKVEYQGN